MSRTKSAIGKSQEVNLPFEEPIGDRIVVRQRPAEDRSAGGIIIPDNSKEKPHYGVVVAVGVKESGKEFQTRVGDLVIFGPYSGTEIQAEGEMFLIMAERDALMILKRNQPTKW